MPVQGVGGLLISLFSQQFNWHSQPAFNSSHSQLISSRSVPAKNCRDGRSRFLKKDSAARVKETFQSSTIKVSNVLKMGSGVLPSQMTYPQSQEDVHICTKEIISDIQHRLCFINQARGKSSDPLRARSLHRMEERMSRGYFQEYLHQCALCNKKCYYYHKNVSRIPIIVGVQQATQVIIPDQ